MLEVRMVVEGDGLFGRWQMSTSQAGNGVFETKNLCGYDVSPTRLFGG